MVVSELSIRKPLFIIIRAGYMDQAHETTCSADSPHGLKSRAVDEKSEVKSIGNHQRN